MNCRIVQRINLLLPMESKGKGKKSGGGGKSRKGKNDDSKGDAAATGTTQVQEEAGQDPNILTGSDAKKEGTPASDKGPAVESARESKEKQGEPKSDDSQAESHSQSEDKKQATSSSNQSKKNESTGAKTETEGRSLPVKSDKAGQDAVDEDPKDSKSANSNAIAQDASGTVLRDDEECFLAGEIIIQAHVVVFIDYSARMPRFVW